MKNSKEEIALNLAESMRFGLEVMAIGFSVVMVTLYVLYLVLLGFARMCAGSAKTGPKQEKISSPQ
jgi:uncharacterized membrane protein (DUF485 family)